MAKKHLLSSLLRWAGTMLLTMLLVAVVKVYQAKHNFTSAHKAAFGIIMLALTLLLGLNFFVSATWPALLAAPRREYSAKASHQEAFRELANVLKPRISGWDVTGDGKRLIEGFDSLLNVLRLWRKTASKALAAFCGAWASNPCHLHLCLHSTILDLLLTLSLLLPDLPQPCALSFGPSNKDSAKDL